MILTDGFPTFVNFELTAGIILPGVAGVLYKEHTVTPPGADSNGPNDTTNMRNWFFRTRQPKKLVTATEMKMECMYDPAILSPASLGVIGGPAVPGSLFWYILRTNALCLTAYPDGSGLMFWGWIDKMVPKDIQEGTSPLADATVIPGNQAWTAPTVTPPGVAGFTLAFGTNGTVGARGGPLAGYPGVVAPAGSVLTEMLPNFIPNVAAVGFLPRFS